MSYFYDNLPNAKGKLIKVSSAISTTEYTGFDILGRVLSHKQTTDGNAYTTNYSYNLSGALIEEIYPSGRVVKNTLDNDGDLQQVQSKKANDTFRNYANSFNYTAAGAVSSLRLGNGKWETTSFNSRLQPTQIGLGSSATNQGLLKLSYDYGTTDNNGNVKSQQISVPNVGANTGFTAIQTYTYDSLNRLKDAKEMIGTTQTWKQTFTFDRYGNRNFDTANTTTLGSCPVNVCNPSINPVNNRLNGYGYDTAGNTTVDAEGKQFTYDAENKQTQVKGANNVVIGQYFYDGDGKRVKKFIYNTQETTIFVYDASGKMVAEYSTTVTPVSEAKVSYLTNDHLGSPRITTDANGQVISRRDFLPFGEEVFTAQRTASLGYAADNVKQKFATYERDNESSLDFAQARMYSYSHGRFTSVDPVTLTVERLTDPQRINLYSYCRNNPYTFVDPTGEIISFANKDAQKKYDEYVEFLNKDKGKYKSELATIERLKNSEVDYQLAVGGKNFEGSEGNLTTDGKWHPSYTTYDIGDEVKAWKAQQNTSTDSDYWKREGGQQKPSLLREFANAKTDDERAGVLARSSYPNRNPRQNSDFVYAGDKDYKPGQLVRTDTSFGRVNRIAQRPK